MKSIQYIILVLIALVQVSCFEVVEEVSLKKDGSGSFKYTVNFSESSSKIKALMMLDEVEGQKVPTEQKIQSEFDKICDLSKTVNGITNVKNSSDFYNFIFEYNCDFEKVENLNGILDSLSHKAESIEYENTEYFSYSKDKKEFIRTGDDVLKKTYDKMSESKKGVFVGARYTGLYRFEEEVQSVSEEKAIVSVNKKAVLHKLELVLLAKKGSAINKHIYLK